MKHLMWSVSAAILISGCKAKVPEIETPISDFAANFQEQLLDAKAGDVIDIPAGTHNFQRSLSLTADGVTLRGAGMDKSILSFKGMRLKSMKAKILSFEMFGPNGQMAPTPKTGHMGYILCKPPMS